MQLLFVMMGNLTHGLWMPRTLSRNIHMGHLPIIRDFSFLDKLLFVFLEGLLVFGGHLVFQDLIDVVEYPPVGSIAIGFFFALAGGVVDNVAVGVFVRNQVIGMTRLQGYEQLGAGIVTGTAEVDVFVVLNLEGEPAVDHIGHGVFLYRRDAVFQHQLSSFIAREVQRLRGGFNKPVLNILDAQNNVHECSQLHRNVEDFFRREFFEFLEVDGLLGFTLLEIAIDGKDTGAGRFRCEE